MRLQIIILIVIGCLVSVLIATYYGNCSKKEKEITMEEVKAENEANMNMIQMLTRETQKVTIVRMFSQFDYFRFIDLDLKDTDGIPDEDLIWVIFQDGAKIPVAYFDASGIAQPLFVIEE